MRAEVLDRHPELDAALEKLTDKITDEEMAAMNYAVESEGKEPRAVAEEFLHGKGIV